MWTPCRCLQNRKKKDKHSFRLLHNVILLRWRWWRWSFKGKTQHCPSALKSAASCSNWKAWRAFGHAEGDEGGRKERDLTKSHVTQPKWHHSVIVRYNGQRQETAILCHRDRKIRPGIERFTFYTATFPPIEDQEQWHCATIWLDFRRK